MAITLTTEFPESTAFKRLVLDRLYPVFNNDNSEALDLRQAMARTGPTVIGLNLTESLSAQTVENTTLKVMPLLFDAPPGRQATQNRPKYDYPHTIEIRRKYIQGKK